MSLNKAISSVGNQLETSILTEQIINLLQLKYNIFFSFAVSFVKDGSSFKTTFPYAKV